MSTDALPAISKTLSPSTTVDPARHPVALYLAGLGAGSRRTMGEALNRIAAWASGGAADRWSLPWHLLRYEHTALLRAALVERYAPATANKMLAALRGVLREAWRLELIDGDSYQRAVDLRSVRATSLPRGRALSQGELRALFGACTEDESPAGARDAALLALLYGSGLRRSEAVGLELGDLNLTDGALTLRAAKGRRDRIVYLGGGAAGALRAWAAIRGSSAGPLFVPVNKAGQLQYRPMSAQAVLYLVRKRARQAGIPRLSPHDLRRTFVSDLLDSGADISVVQQLAGHAHVSTTTRYDRRGEAAKRRASALLHVPWAPRSSDRHAAAELQSG